MPDAKHYAEKLKVQIDEWAEDIDDMKTRIDAAALRAKAEIEKQIKELQARQKDIGEQLDILKRKSGAALEEVKIGMDAAMVEMKTAVEKAMKKFRET